MQAEPNHQLTELVEIYLEIYPILMQIIARKLDDKHDAEEIMQNLYFSISRKREDSERRIVNKKGYLYRAAINAASQLLRRKQRENELFNKSACIDLVHATERQAQPDLILQGQERIALLDSAISSLPQRRRLAFTLHIFSDFSREEIAQELQVSISAVNKGLSRALVQCRSNLSDTALAA